jgi:hypothetical protein
MQSSGTIKEIATALSKFQAEVKNPANSANNPFFKSKYAPLNEILNDVRPLLAKNGLSILQFPSGDGQNIVVTTALLHDSGEWIESEPLVLKAVKADPQGAGSCITYARRYAVAAILGISSEDDDDGNAATHGKGEPEKKTSSKATPPKQDKPVPSPEKINQKAMSALHAKAAEIGMSHEELSLLAQEKYRVDGMASLTTEQGRELYSHIAKLPPKQAE